MDVLPCFLIRNPVSLEWRMHVLSSFLIRNVRNVEWHVAVAYLGFFMHGASNHNGSPWQKNGL